MALFVGIVIGLVLGLTGSGGSVFAVPLLVMLMGLPTQQAIGLSLGTVAASAILGVILKLKSQQIEWLPALVFAIFGGLAAPVGNWANQYIAEQVLLIGFALLVAIIAIRMWYQASMHPETTRIVRAGTSINNSDNSAVCVLDKGQKFHIGLPCVLGLGGGAVFTGALSGMLGVGGGFLIVPILLYLTNISIRQAVATSLVVIAFIASFGFISYIALGSELSGLPLTHLITGGAAGMLVGIVASKRLAGPSLQKFFSLALFAIVAATLFTKLVI